MTSFSYHSIATIYLKEFERIKTFAEQNKVDANTLLAMGEKLIDPAGVDANYTCKFENLTVAYSIEEQPFPVGWTRHLSLSQKNCELVDPTTTSIIMSHFGFKELNPLNSYYNLDEQSNPKVVHILEPLDCKWDDLELQIKDDDIRQ